MSDKFIKMQGPTSMYQSQSGVIKVWHKGNKVLETQSMQDANAEYSKRIQLE